MLSVLGSNVMAPDRAQLDLSNPDQLRRIIRDLRPNVIINPAAYTAVDKAESNAHEARSINAVAPGVIGEEAQQIGALVIHFSTDYVFDGKKQGAYVEDDETNPQSVYGATKREGELALAASGADHIILRTSWVVSNHGSNFVKTILRLAQERDSLSIVADQHGAPTTAAFLADMIQLIVARKSKGQALPSGVCHLVPGGTTTWHGLAQFVVKAAEDAGVPVKVRSEAIGSTTTASYNAPAKRPLNSVLDTNKFQTAFGVSLPMWQEGVTGVLNTLLGQGAGSA